MGFMERLQYFSRHTWQQLAFAKLFRTLIGERHPHQVIAVTETLIGQAVRGDSTDLALDHRRGSISVFPIRLRIYGSVTDHLASPTRYQSRPESVQLDIQRWASARLDAMSGISRPINNRSMGQTLFSGDRDIKSTQLVIA